jgi:hypothetical protein
LVGRRLLSFPLVITFRVKYDSTVVPSHLLFQKSLVNVNPSFVRLLKLMNIHKAEHCPDTLPHAIVSFTCSTPASLAVACNDVHGLDRSQLFRLEVWYKTFFEPPLQRYLSASKGEKMQVQLKPMSRQACNLRVKASFNA